MILEDFSFGYKNQTLVESLYLQIDFPELIIILGNNGSGKSSFFNAIRGQINSSGNLFISKTKIKPSNRINFFSFLGQSYHFSFPFIVNDFLRISRQKVDEQLLSQLIEKMEIQSFLNLSILELSQGQLQKCLIVQTLVQNQEIVLLDEPESFLDIKNRNTLIECLKWYKKTYNKLILVVTHDLDLALKSEGKLLNFSSNHLALEPISLPTINKHRELLIS